MDKSNFFTASDGAVLYYEDRGNGVPFLLMPGFLATTKFFEKNIEVLAEKYRVIVFDPRGQGRSAKVCSGNTMERNALDIRDLIEHLRLEDVILGGWSMGSSVVVSYASMMQEAHLKGIILIDGSLFPMSPDGWNKHRSRDYNVDNWLENYMPLIFDREALFVAAIVPGLLLAASFVAVNLVTNRNKKAAVTVSYSRKEIMESFIQAVPVLLLPVIILGGIYTGIFTPTEAAVTCVIYSLVLGIAYREMKLSDLLSAMKKTVVTSGMVMFIMAMSANFGWILSAAKIPTTVANALVPYLGSRLVFTVLLLILLFVAGCFMEVLALVVILAPILIPIGVQLGMDTLHLGVTFCIALVMGLITPPFGMNLFTAAAVCDTTFVEIVKGALPYICVALIMITLFAFVPQITLFLPGLMAG